MSGVVGLYYDMWGGAAAGPPAQSRNPRQLYRRAVWFKSNPRSAADMERLFHETWAEGHFINVSESQAWRREAADCETLVLLYPDAIGLGFGAIERKIRAANRGTREVLVLNGRKRNFSFTPATRGSLWLRRMLERTMAGELLFALPFLIATPLMLSFDLVRGRR